MSEKPPYRLQDLIDLAQFQALQDRLNEIYTFPSAIIDNQGQILTATAWQEVCTCFHRRNPETELECIKSDQYILSHMEEANPAVSYICPHGLIDNATPIIIDGIHYGNFFTGQFFLEKPNLEFFRQQALKYGFDETSYLAAVQKVPVWSQKQMESYLFFIKGLIEVISSSGLKKLKEIETRQQMEASEERANTILSQMKDGFWVANTTGQILDTNQAMCQMLGYERAELLEMSIANLEVRDSPEEIIQRIELIIQNGSANFESQFRCKNGELIDLDISITFLPARNQFFAIHRDITARKRAEAALRESEEKLRTVFNTMEEGVALNELVFDENGEAVDYKILEINPAYEEISFLNREQALNHLATEIYYMKPTEIKAFWELHRYDEHAIKTDMYIPQINKWRHVSTSKITGNRFATLFFDNTEQKNAEIALRESEEKFKSLFEQAGDYALILAPNAEQGIPIIDANEAACRVHGYTREELIGQPIALLDPHSQFNQTFCEKLHASETIRFETWHRRKDGMIFPVESFAKLVRIEGKSPIIFVTEHDITERKQAEERITQALAEKETLLRELYHRTKNNMAVINALLGLQASYFTDQPLKQAFEETQSRISSMALVHQKLYEASDLSRINLKSYISDLTELMRQSYTYEPDQIAFVLDLEDVFVLIDTAIPCGLILNELISNALIHAFPNGRQGEIKVQLRREADGKILLGISDNGVGLPPGFDPLSAGRMGLQILFSLAEYQLKAKINYAATPSVTCEILFQDNLYKPRV